MTKKKIKKNVKSVKKEIEDKKFSGEAKHILIVSLSVLLFLGLFYLITVVILNDNTSKSNDDVIEAEFQRDEILIGTSFSVKDSEYFVLYYETDDEEVGGDLTSLVSTYRSSNAKPYVYTVDMSNALNSAFNSDDANRNATKPSELAIDGPTLIRFVDGEIAEYIEGVEKINKTLQ